MPFSFSSLMQTDTQVAFNYVKNNVKTESYILIQFLVFLEAEYMLIKKNQT